MMPELEKMGDKDYRGNIVDVYEMRCSSESFRFVGFSEHLRGSGSDSESEVAAAALGFAIAHGDVRKSKETGEIQFTDKGVQRAHDFIDEIHS